MALKALALSRLTHPTLLKTTTATTPTNAARLTMLADPRVTDRIFEIIAILPTPGPTTAAVAAGLMKLV
jgi:hypothetical protein